MAAQGYQAKEGHEQVFVGVVVGGAIVRRGSSSHARRWHALRGRVAIEQRIEAREDGDEAKAREEEAVPLVDVVDAAIVRARLH